MEILKQALPGIARVAVLWDTFGRVQLDALHRAAKVLDVHLELIQFARAQDLRGAFATARRKKAGAILLLWSPVFYVNRVRVGALALQAQFPIITELTPVVYAGGLLSYGSERDHNWERSAYFIDRLLKGTKAANLPVERLSRFKLVVNLRTANALGLTIPESILIRADEVIR